MRALWGKVCMMTVIKLHFKVIYSSQFSLASVQAEKYRINFIPSKLSVPRLVVDILCVNEVIATQGCSLWSVNVDLCPESPVWAVCETHTQHHMPDPKYSARSCWTGRNEISP